jgi:hypothetical protein
MLAKPLLPSLLLGLATLAPPAAHAQTVLAHRTLPAADSAARPAPVTWTTLTGAVVDELNYPLAGATVTLRGHANRVCITNSDGRYLLTVPSTGGDVAVAFSGYQDQVIHFSKALALDMVLVPKPGFKRDRKARVIYRRVNRNR